MPFSVAQSSYTRISLNYIASECLNVTDYKGLGYLCIIDTQDYCVYGLRPSSGILKEVKINSVSLSPQVNYTD
jgi:hypothetical protein